MARLDSDFLERLVMRLGRGRREVSEILDVMVRYPCSRPNLWWRAAANPAG